MADQGIDVTEASRQARVEQHFRSVCQDLEFRLDGSVTEYDALQVAALLHLLLLDDGGLLIRANRRCRLNVRFRVARALASRPAFLDEAVFTLDVMNLNDGPQEHWSEERVTIGAFRSLEVARVQQAPFTVEDVVHVAANALGGRHLGEPKQARRVPLRDMHDAFSLDGRGLLAPALEAIAERTLEAVKELRVALR